MNCKWLFSCANHFLEFFPLFCLDKNYQWALHSLLKTWCSFEMNSGLCQRMRVKIEIMVLITFLQNTPLKVIAALYYEEGFLITLLSCLKIWKCGIFSWQSLECPQFFCLNPKYWNSCKKGAANLNYVGCEAFISCPFRVFHKIWKFGSSLTSNDKQKRIVEGIAMDEKFLYLITDHNGKGGPNLYIFEKIWGK